VVYRISGEDREHPTPLVLERDGAVALVQPLGVGRKVMFRLEGESFSGDRIVWPAHGERSFVIERMGPLPIGRLLAKVEGRK